MEQSRTGNSTWQLDKKHGTQMRRDKHLFNRTSPMYPLLEAISFINRVNIEIAT